MSDSKNNTKNNFKRRIKSEKMNSDFVTSLYPTNFERINEESFRSNDSIAFLKCEEDSVFLKNKLASENRIISDMKFFNRENELDPNDVNVNLSNIDDPINDDINCKKNINFFSNGIELKKEVKNSDKSKSKKKHRKNITEFILSSNKLKSNFDNETIAENYLDSNIKLLEKDKKISEFKNKMATLKKISKKKSSEIDKNDEMEKVKKTNNIFLSLIHEDNKSLNNVEKANVLNTKYRQISLYFSQDAFNTLLQGIIALISIFVTFFDYLMLYETDTDIKIKSSRLSSSFCFILTILLLNSIFLEFMIKSKLLSMIYTIPEWVFRSDWKFCLEYIFPVAISIFHPTPFTINTYIQLKTTRDVGYVEYRLNDIFSCLLMFRLFFIFKAYVFYSKNYSPRTSRISKMYGTSINFNYFVKTISQDKAFVTYAILFLLVWIFGTFGLIVSESPLHYNDSQYFNFYNIWNSIWCTFITIMTIGYGDFYPITSFGRIIMVCSVLGGLVLLSTLVSTLNSILNMTDDELTVTNILNSINMNEETRLRSKNLLVEFAIIKKMIDEYKKNKYANNEELLKRQNDLKEYRKKIIISKNEFKNSYKAIEELTKSQENENNGFEYKTNQLSEQLDNLKNKIKSAMLRIDGFNTISRNTTANIENIKKKLSFGIITNIKENQISNESEKNHVKIEEVPVENHKTDN